MLECTYIIYCNFQHLIMLDDFEDILYVYVQLYVTIVDTRGHCIPRIKQGIRNK